MESNYTVYHLHSDLSNGVTNIDSVTKYGQYIERAKECGMKALAFSEHGSAFEFYFKKLAIEAAGMKYIHAVEAYITMTLEEKVRDSYHCVLIAKNYDGFLELNRLVSKSFDRKNGNHFYYVPRLSMDELEATSDNILVTSACLGGALNSSKTEDAARFLKFLSSHKDRCYLEVQHHNCKEQKVYNDKLVAYSKLFDIPLIAGTDTHALNEVHAKGRSMLQKGKGVHFENEDDWDLTFKTYDELVRAYRIQDVLSEDEYLEAIENTNRMADMIEPFEIDTSIKYPNVFEDPVAQFRDVVCKSIYTHPYALKNHSEEELKQKVEEELSVYEATKSTPYVLLKYELVQWEREHGIYTGYGRGSVNGSMIAYLLDITNMDSMRFDLNMFRFMNPERVSVADIDSDYSANDRERVKNYLLDEHMGYPSINAAEIITFNTIATKGAIRDIARAMGYTVVEASAICNSLDADDSIPDSLREAYPELFEYVDIVTGVIVSIGSHPCGVLVSDHDIEAEIGLCSTSGSEYPVTCLYMKELDNLMYVKWDILGLDNVALINDTCKLAGIERLTPDNTDLEDMDVWRSIRDDTTNIFQFESDMASDYLKRFMSDEILAKAKARDRDFSMIKWLSFANGLLRPGCASYRDDVANGNVYDNGLPELNEFLVKEAGHLTMQETIMQWLVKFCGYSGSESDSVRRAIAKKKGTEELLPEIERRFIEYTSSTYDVPIEKCKEVIKPFIQTILDASRYSFSWNHSDAYSCIAYISGYLRYYYPLEFLTTSLNVFTSKNDKTIRITEYANKHGIKVLSPKFGFSGANYIMNKEQNAIYKGLSSIKYVGSDIGDALYAMKDSIPSTFLDFLKISPCDSRQHRILAKLDFFSMYGKRSKILDQIDLFESLYTKKNGVTTPKKSFKKDKIDYPFSVFEKHGRETEKQFFVEDMDAVFSDISESYSNKDIRVSEIVAAQSEYLGYVEYTNPKCKGYYYVQDLDTRYAPKLTLYDLSNGDVTVQKMKMALYTKTPFNRGDIIFVEESEYKHKYMKDSNGQWIESKDEYIKWITRYQVYGGRNE